MRDRGDFSKHWTGLVEPLQFQGAQGPVLGVFEKAIYENSQGKAAVNDLIALFTDGLFEVETADDEYYGPNRLLAAMRRYSKPVNPKLLGVIGAEHFKERFLAAGGNLDTFKYQCRKGMTSDDIPYLVEFAFGLHQSGLLQSGAGASRKFVAGANWSAGITSQPVICALHLASAHIQYADRGKSSIILTDDARQPDD